jgi:hypothetical protein
MLNETDIYRLKNGNLLVSLLELKFFCYLLVIKKCGQKMLIMIQWPGDASR